MRLPRDLSGQDLIQALNRLGYRQSRQTGSHVRLSTDSQGEHHVTIPNHDPLRIGTLGAILTDVATHFKLDRSALIDRLFS
ncbi:MAG: type II toxin-antitoxin system HicA family toxin [Candidatus Sericytochromatia bacterium]|nr:type II toxin-antitoxin system HicA family toxin [Candidatus Sericytochromatia bacterium]